MKVLILVLSCLRDPYDKLMKAQQRTWDSVDVPGVETIYYYGDNTGFKKISHYSREFGADSRDDLKQAHWKYTLTLREVMSQDWDFIFRTNASSYVHKRELLKMAEKLPNEKCYCGRPGDCNMFASGSGHFISRDVAQILVDEMQCNIGSDVNYVPDDVYIGQILIKNHGLSVTPGSERVDYYSDGHNRDFKTYHYRCKNEDNRQGDIDAFEWLFQKHDR